MELKKTPLQNLKDILLDADSQADAAAKAARAYSDQVVGEGNAKDEESVSAQYPQPVENRVENVSKNDILLKISSLEKDGDAFRTSYELYAAVRSLWDPDTP